GPIRLGPGELFLEHFGTASGHELGVLRGQVLIAGRNPCISVCRHFPLQIWRTFAPIFAGINDREIAGGYSPLLRMLHKSGRPRPPPRPTQSATRSNALRTSR